MEIAMREYKGKSVFAGIAIGRIKVYNKSEQQVKRVHIDDTQHEKERYAEAVEKAVEQLQMLYDKALKEVGEAKDRKSTRLNSSHPSSSRMPSSA